MVNYGRLVASLCAKVSKAYDVECCQAVNLYSVFVNMQIERYGKRKGFPYVVYKNI